MKIFISSDHAGFSFKQDLIKHFSAQFQFEDLGPLSDERVDYPDFADQVVKKLLASPQNNFGILICGSGQGMAMRANKFPNIRAALCWNEEVAQLSRAHNDANILCLGARLLTSENAYKITEIFLKTPFEGERHAARVKKISKTID